MKSWRSPEVLLKSCAVLSSKYGASRLLAGLQDLAAEVALVYRRLFHRRFRKSEAGEPMREGRHRPGHAGRCELRELCEPYGGWASRGDGLDPK